MPRSDNSKCNIDVITLKYAIQQLNLIMYCCKRGSNSVYTHATPLPAQPSNTTAHDWETPSCLRFHVTRYLFKQSSMPRC